MTEQGVEATAAWARACLLAAPAPQRPGRLSFAHTPQDLLPYSGSPVLKRGVLRKAAAASPGAVPSRFSHRPCFLRAINHPLKGAWRPGRQLSSQAVLHQPMRPRLWRPQRSGSPKAEAAPPPGGRLPLPPRAAAAQAQLPPSTPALALHQGDPDTSCLQGPGLVGRCCVGTGKGSL